MATLEQLEKALIAADKAGNAEDAKALAKAVSVARVKKMITPTLGNKVGALTDSAAQAMTFNTSDEIAAGLNSGFGTFGNYGDKLTEERARMAENARLAPGYGVAGTVAGALTGGTGMAKSGLSLLNKAKTLPQAVGLGTAEGSIYGGLFGAGGAEGGLDDRARGGAVGSVAGGLMGGISPVALKTVQAALRPVTSKLRTTFGTPGSKARARIEMGMGGQTPEKITQRLDDLGPEGMLIDTLGSKGEALGRSAVNTSPEARDILQGASSGRMAGQPERLTSALSKASGLSKPMTMKELQAVIQAERSPAIDKAYKAAREAGFDLPSGPFRDLMKAPMLQEAMEQAEKDVLNSMAARGGGFKGAASKLAVFDQAKKILDDRASAAYRVGKGNEGEIASGLARTLRETVDAHVPVYGGARALAQSSTKAQQAVELGAEGAKPNIPLDYARRVASAADENAPNVAQGYASGKIGQIENRRTTAGVVDALFGSRQQKSALTAALKNKAPSVEAQLAAERAFGNTDRALAGNSNTARQLAEMGVTAGAGAGLGLAYGGDAQSAGMGAVTAALLRRGGGAALKGLTAKSEAQVAPIIAQLLSGQTIPKEIVARINKSPTLQKALIAALTSQAGSLAGKSAL